MDRILKPKEKSAEILGMKALLLDRDTVSVAWRRGGCPALAGTVGGKSRERPAAPWLLRRMRSRTRVPPAVKEISCFCIL